MSALTCAFAVLICMLLAGATAQDQYMQVPCPPSNGTAPLLTYTREQRTYNNHSVTAHYAWVDNACQFFRVLYPTSPKSGAPCQWYDLPSRVAPAEGCLYATNGGPFAMHQPRDVDSCIGYVVGDGVVAFNQSTSNVNFGLTSNSTWIMGVLTPEEVQSMGITQLLTGFQWLLTNGTGIPAAGGEIAPRTAIGTDESGRLLVFEADGVERRDWGLTLAQAGEWVQSLGAQWVVNMDGGGSSITVYQNKIVSVPHCSDTVIPCERPVTTTICIMDGA